MKRAFKHSAWLHGFLYLVLFVAVSWLALGGMMAAQHNVLAKCNGPLPPRDQSSALLPAGPGRGLWGKPELNHVLEHFVLDKDDEDHHHHSHDEDDGNDGDHSKHHHNDDDHESHPGKHHVDDDHDSHHGKNGHKHDKDGHKDIKEKSSDAAWTVKVASAPATFNAVDTFETRKMLPGRKPEEDPLSSEPICMPVILPKAAIPACCMWTHRESS